MSSFATSTVEVPVVRRTPLLIVTPWVLGIITAFVLVSNIPAERQLAQFSVPFTIYLVLTAFSLIFGVILSQGELSPAHMIGILAFLSYPPDARSAITYAIFLGGVIGSVGGYARKSFRTRRKSATVLSLQSGVMVVARVTLSYWAAGQVYIAAGGRLPVGRLPEDLLGVTLPLVIYALVYVTLYFSIFLLESYCLGYAVRQIIIVDLSRVAVILILPIPFSILGAEIISTLENASKAILLAGIGLIIFALYSLSVSEYRLRKQLEEMRTLSVVTRAMRTHLDLDALLRTIYVQVAHLLEIDNFQVVLYDLDEQRLNFSLTIRQGQQEPSAIQTVDKHENSLLGHLLRSEGPLVITEDVADRARQYGVAPPDAAVISWLGVPLQAGGRMLGAMIVISRDATRKFNRDDMRLLNIVAASSSIAIENAQLYRQQTERAEQLVTLNRVSSLMSATLSPDAIIEIVISSASTISNAQAVALYLYADEATNDAALRVYSAGLSGQFTVSPPDPILLQYKGSSSARVPITVTDVATDTRLNGARTLLQNEKKLAFVELPLTKGDQFIGVLVVYYEQPQMFSGDKVELFKTFANQAAQAILNAQRYSITDAAFQRSVEQLVALTAIGRLLASTIDLNTISDLVLSHTTAATGVEVGSVLLFAEGSHKPQVASQKGYPSSSTDSLSTFKLNIAPQVIESGETYRIEDIRTQSTFTPIVPSTRSIMSVPILQANANDVFGVITLESSHVGAFSSEDEQFVSQIATQAVIAISNARSFHRISEDRDRLRVLMDAMEEGIMLIDAQGKIVLANPRINLIGLKQSDVLNHSLTELLDDTSLGFVQKAGFASYEDACDLVAGLRTFRSYTPVMYVVQADLGELHIRRQIVPVRDESGETLGVLLVFYNKTEEQELARSREEFSRMIVHDLRSPLTAVTTSLKLLEEIIPKDAEFYGLVETTTDASRRAIKKLLGRVDSILDVAKMESGQISVDVEPTELADLAENVRNELNPLAQELNIRIEKKVSPTLLPLNVDPDKVERLLLNLVDNALKYSPRGSTIMISHTASGANGANAGFIRIDVTDQGPGVPQEYKETLFNRFVQIEGRRKVRRGVGLGLTFCRMVVEAHRGRIWIEDNPGGGSVFAFTLPVVSLDGLDDDD